MKRKASPFLPENFVVASGWQRQGDKQVTGEYFGRGPRPFDWFTKLLTGTTILVGQNIKFDLLYALREPQNLEAWMAFVARGGNVWDVQLAEYLLPEIFKVVVASTIKSQAAFRSWLLRCGAPSWLSMRSGFRCTARTRCQLRMRPFHRSGLRCRAVS
ncbi:hypothetical protein LMG28138_03919 [Pararobbsia alpina]|uniref:Exonuclease domain-containing protein n=1 Tax=Pararobbsia alpina TaxID=621374 RepID=A0A6S7CQY3_9BURK|nr:hypothetical protein LMG28138_03919 [Pararobbsia alpina]